MFFPRIKRFMGHPVAQYFKVESKFPIVPIESMVRSGLCKFRSKGSLVLM